MARQAHLAEEWGISRRTVQPIVERLVSADVVVHAGKRGPLRLHPKLGYLVGVDVTHACATVAISDLAYNVLAKNSKAIPIRSGQASLEAIGELIAEQLDAVAEKRSEVRERLIGVGLALPGPIRRSRNPAPKKDAAEWDRLVEAGRILPGWDDIDAGAALANILKNDHGVLPPRHEGRRIVWVENDASAGALGAYTRMRLLMDEEAPDDIVYVRMTTGIGAGIVNKGHLVNGGHGFAGELGHVSIAPGGGFCSACGGRGCLETVASNRALLRQLQDVVADDDQPVPDDDAHAVRGEGAAHIDGELERILAHDHPAVDRAVWDAGWQVGTVLASVCCLLNPTRIVFDGLLPGYKDPVVSLLRTNDSEVSGAVRGPFLRAVEHAIQQNAMPHVRDVRLATWADLQYSRERLTPELLGALALALDHLGDGYLLKPVGRWMSIPASRAEGLDFSLE
jgi:predicted NBD/HSP70 family sugar kinase